MAERSTWACWGLLGFVLMLTGCATAPHEPPRISVSGLRPVHMDLLEQEYELRLRIQNRGDKPLKIRGMAYDIYLNGHRFASGVNATPVEVPAFGERVVPVHVVTGVFDWLRQLNALSREKPARLSYRLEGSMKLAGWPRRVPFQQDGTLEFPATGGPRSRPPAKR